MQLGSSWGRVQLQGAARAQECPGAPGGLSTLPPAHLPAALGIIRASPLNSEELGLAVQPCLVLLSRAAQSLVCAQSYSFCYKMLFPSNLSLCFACISSQWRCLNPGGLDVFS